MLNIVDDSELQDVFVFNVKFKWKNDFQSTFQLIFKICMQHLHTFFFNQNQDLKWKCSCMCKEKRVLGPLSVSNHPLNAPSVTNELL